MKSTSNMLLFLFASAPSDLRSQRLGRLLYHQPLTQGYQGCRKMTQHMVREHKTVTELQRQKVIMAAIAEIRQASDGVNQALRCTPLSSRTPLRDDLGRTCNTVHAVRPRRNQHRIFHSVQPACTPDTVPACNGNLLAHCGTMIRSLAAICNGGHCA